MERPSSPHWPVAWYLSPRCLWRRKAKRTRRMEDKRLLPPLLAPTLTYWHAAFWTLARTAHRGSFSRIWTPPHPPKHRGAILCVCKATGFFFFLILKQKRLITNCGSLLMVICHHIRPRRASFGSKEAMKGADSVTHQLTKKLQHLKKKIKQFEEQFEKERNYKVRSSR